MSDGNNRKNVGYARVSTDEQNLDLQIDALRKAHCGQIFFDKGISGARIDRPGLNAALSSLSFGDKLIVWRLDRLGRSLKDLIRIIELLTGRGLLFRSLSEEIDTTSAGGKLIFHVMAALAEFERGLIAERTRAGMAAAKARGRHLGRRPLLFDGQRVLAAAMVSNGDLTVAQAAVKFDVSDSSIRRWMRQYRLQRKWT